MSTDPRQAIIEALTRPAGRRQITGHSPSGWRSVKTTDGPFASADPASIQFLKERASGSHRIYAVTYTDDRGVDHLELVGAVQAADGHWTRSGGAGGSGKGPPRDRPWLNFAGWRGPDIFAGGGQVIGTGAERAKRVELAFDNGTNLGDSVDEGLVLFIKEQTLEIPVTAHILDDQNKILATHAVFDTSPQ